MNSFRSRFLFVALLLLVSSTFPVHAAAPTYAPLLLQALDGIENGRHAQAAAPLKKALTLDRNEPAGLIALGALYLHTGSWVRARKEFDRARTLAPGDPLAAFGSALADVALRKGDTRAFRALDSSAVPAAPTMDLYLRLLAGDATVLRSELGGVTDLEPDALRLQVAAFAALRGGDAARGEKLLAALLARPGMDRLAEDRALILPFETSAPAQGGAPVLPSAIGLPEPAAGGQPLSGSVSLSPGRDLPRDVAFVSYTTDGGGYAASTNYAPWVTQWNTARLPNGLYTLRTTAYDASGGVAWETARTVTLANKNAPRGDRLSAAQQSLMRTRLLALLSPRVCRKAAHWALAERATAKSDGPGALAHIEAVVAIDPLFRNARTTLRRYNLAVDGPRAGIWQAATREKLVALTFDDGPNPAPNRTPALLDALKAANAAATFFVVGFRAEQSPHLVTRMASEGHEVANHSYSHQNMTFLSPVSVERELCRTSVLIRTATGRRPRFFRPPGGNNNSGVIATAEALGMAGAYWTVDAYKKEDAASRPALVNYVLRETKPGAIVLLHNAPDVTVASVGEIVRGLRAKGYTLVTLSELVRRTKNGTVAKK